MKWFWKGLLKKELFCTNLLNFTESFTFHAQRGLTQKHAILYGDHIQYSGFELVVLFLCS